MSGAESQSITTSDVDPGRLCFSVAPVPARRLLNANSITLVSQAPLMVDELLGPAFKTVADLDVLARRSAAMPTVISDSCPGCYQQGLQAPVVSRSDA